MFELGENLFDGIEIRAVWRQKQQVGSGRADRLANGLVFVTSEIVHHHHIARLECRNPFMFDIGSEDVAIHRAIEYSRRVDPVMSQGGNEGRGIPVAEGGSAWQVVTLWCPAPDRHYVRLHPGFVNEHETARVDPMLVALPALPATFHVRAIALVATSLRRGNAPLGPFLILLSYLKLNPQTRRKRQTVSWLTWTPRAASIS